MTKVQAIAALLRDNNGVGSWRYIYDNIEKYYPGAKASKEWEAGIRGVLYRELKNDRNFKKVGIGVYALTDYSENEAVETATSTKIKKHAYIESILVQIGNLKKFLTYCADPTAYYYPGVSIGELMTLKEFPQFSYPEINATAKRIDVTWFRSGKYKFPIQAIEVVDSIGTLVSSLNRLSALEYLQCDFLVVLPDKHKRKALETIERAPYAESGNKFDIKTYEEIEAHHKYLVEASKYEF